MGAVQHLLHLLQSRDLAGLVQWAGYGGLALIIFVETGLFFGFFLPGDSVLVTAGLLASQGLPINVFVLALLLNIAAVAGDNTNYWVGRLSGFGADTSNAPTPSTSGTGPRRSCSPASCRSSAPSPRSSPASPAWTIARS
jgi:hypothetical protein